MNAYHYKLSFFNPVELDPGINGDEREEYRELKVTDYRLDHRGFIELTFPDDERRRVQGAIEHAQKI